MIQAGSNIAGLQPKVHVPAAVYGIILSHELYPPISETRKLRNSRVKGLVWSHSNICPFPVSKKVRWELKSGWTSDKSVFRRKQSTAGTGETLKNKKTGKLSCLSQHPPEWPLSWHESAFWEPQVRNSQDSEWVVSTSAHLWELSSLLPQSLGKSSKLEPACSWQEVLSMWQKLLAFFLPWLVVSKPNK